MAVLGKEKLNSEPLERNPCDLQAWKKVLGRNCHSIDKSGSWPSIRSDKRSG